MSPGDTKQYAQLTDIKRKNPALKVYISIGGSQHEDLDSLFEFGLKGGGGDPTRFGSFGSVSRRQASHTESKRSVHGTHFDKSCKGIDLLGLDQIPADVPAQIQEVKLGDHISFGSMNAQINTLRLVIPTFSATPVTIHTTTTTCSRRPRACDGARYPQACAHYSSVITQQGDPASLLTCSNIPVSSDARPLTSIYKTKQHNNPVRKNYIAASYIAPGYKRKKTNCQMDEWPQARFQQGTAWGYIRLLPGDQNGGVPGHDWTSNLGSGWKRFCNFPPRSHVEQPQGGPAGTVIITTVITLNVMSYTWKNIAKSAGGPEALTANVCRPTVLTGDVGYPLFTDDPWYTSQGITIHGDYNSDPGPRTSTIARPLYKRELDTLDELDFVDGNLIVDNGNSSRPLSHEELELLGYTECATPECEAEYAILKEQQEALGRLPDREESGVSTAASTPTTAYDLPASKARASLEYPTATKSATRSDVHRRRHARFAHHHGY